MDERQTFEKNYRENWGKIYHMIGRFVSDAATVEDLTQHTFLRAWVKRQTFRGESSYRTWLTSIAINSALNHIKYQKCRPKYLQVEQYDQDINQFSDGINTLTRVITAQEMDHLFKAIGQLPNDMQMPLVLSVIYEHSYEEIALALEIPIGTVRSRIHRARYALKELLK